MDWRGLLGRAARLAWREARRVDEALGPPTSEWARRQGAGRVIVFVHGLLGERERAWRTLRSDWISIVLDDPAMAGYDVLAAEWYSSVLSGGFDLADGARELLDHLSAPLEGGVPALEARELVFVAHSMGGLVARQALVASAASFERVNVGLVSLGTPAKGVALASRFEPLARSLGHQQVLALRAGSPELTELDTRFTELVKSQRLNIGGVELVESHLVVPPTALRWLRVPSPPLVGVGAQGRYFGDPVVLPWTDHRSISRPTDPGHPSHAALREFLTAQER